MCNYFVDLKDVSNYFDLSIDELHQILDYSESKFNDFIDDNLLEIDDNKITVHKKGRLVTRNISMRFDPLIKKKIGTYSKTI